MTIRLPSAAAVVENPSQDDLRTLVSQMPNTQETNFGNFNYTARVVSRSGASTFVVTDDASFTQVQAIDREEYRRVSELQDQHIATAEMILVEGYIGPENSPMRVPVRLYIEKSQANIPAMQQQLYYDRDADWSGDEAFTVIYTPSLPVEGYPSERLITIDLENWVTRVFNADYFGESKMGGLRMWNEWVYQRGGLAMHSGAKVIPTGNGDKVALIVGMSGTGKTTTTFTRQNNSLPVQDDFVALVPSGDVYSTEDGCFAKTIGLDPEKEPIIHAALTSPESWLENVAVADDGAVDFSDATYTANGRGTFELDMIQHFDPRKLGKADFLLILNRNEDIVPAVARMQSVEQAVAYFMLGETKGTSAGGAAEAGKSMRVPGTNPFFLQFDYMQGNRIAELIRSMDYDFGVYVLSTGRAGGGPDVEESKKVTIPVSSAIVKGIAEGTIEWEVDPDFGYGVATAVPGVADDELLQPRKLYERTGRSKAYSDIVDRLKRERREFLAGHEGLADEFINAVG